MRALTHTHTHTHTLLRPSRVSDGRLPSFQSMKLQPSLSYHKTGLQTMIKNNKGTRQKFVYVLNRSGPGEPGGAGGPLTLASHDDCGQRGRVVCLQVPLGLLEEKEMPISFTSFDEFYNLSSVKSQEAWNTQPAAPVPANGPQGPTHTATCAGCCLSLPGLQL